MQIFFAISVCANQLSFSAVCTHAEIYARVTSARNDTRVSHAEIGRTARWSEMTCKHVEYSETYVTQPSVDTWGWCAGAQLITYVSRSLISVSGMGFNEHLRFRRDYRTES